MLAPHALFERRIRRALICHAAFTTIFRLRLSAAMMLLLAIISCHAAIC